MGGTTSLEETPFEVINALADRLMSHSGFSSDENIKLGGATSHAETPFEVIDALAPAKDRLKSLVDGIAADVTFPFGSQIVKALKYLSEPDLTDDECAISLKAADMFVQFMKNIAIKLVEPPLLSVAAGGGLVAGWEKNQSQCVFLYFMPNGLIQFVSRRPSHHPNAPLTLDLPL